MQDERFASYCVFSNSSANGFYDSDPVVQEILRKLYGSYAYSADLLNSYRNRLTWYTYTRHMQHKYARDTAFIFEKCMPYYKPYPMQDSWTEEYKAYYLSEVAEKHYPGECLVPYDLAEKLLVYATRDYMMGWVKEGLAEVENDLNQIEKSKQRGTFSMTEEEADKKAKQYNDTYNEGGGGYVPEFWTSKRESYTRKRFDELSEFAAKLEAMDEPKF